MAVIQMIGDPFILHMPFLFLNSQVRVTYIYFIDIYRVSKFMKCQECPVNFSSMTYIFLFPLQDVYIIDTKKDVFVWVGGEASVDERRNAITYAHVRTATISAIDEK